MKDSTIERAKMMRGMFRILRSAGLAATEAIARIAELHNVSTFTAKDSIYATGAYYDSRPVGDRRRYNRRRKSRRGARLRSKD
jgi:hypothetical protein